MQEHPYKSDQKTPKYFVLLTEYVVEEINYRLFICPVLQRVDVSMLLSDNLLKISLFFSPNIYITKYIKYVFLLVRTEYKDCHSYLLFLPREMQTSEIG